MPANRHRVRKNLRIPDSNLKRLPYLRMGRFIVPGSRQRPRISVKRIHIMAPREFLLSHFKSCLLYTSRCV